MLRSGRLAPSGEEMQSVGRGKNKVGTFLEKISQVGLKTPPFSRARVSYFSFFSFTSSPVCRKVLYL